MQRTAAIQTFPVRLKPNGIEAMPNAAIEGKDRSISPVITTSVSGMAMIAKYGVDDMNAL